MGALAFLTHLTAASVLVTALTDADCEENDLCDEASLVTLKKEFAIENVSGSDTVSFNIAKAEPVNVMVF